MEEVYDQPLSFWERIKQAIAGVAIGFVLFLVSFVVLWWNEGRAVKTHKNLLEGKAAVISVSADPVDAANQGKLIHFSGDTKISKDLTDKTFGVTLPAIHLIRTVEMYQYVEKKETKKEGERRVTSYKYSQQWKEDIVSSNNFNDKTYKNPTSMPYRSESFVNSPVEVGAFILSSTLIGDIRSASQPIEAQSLQDKINPAIAQKLKAQGNYFFISQNPSSPQIGDIRIQFSAASSPTKVSVIAKQNNNTLESYTTSGDMKIEWLYLGEHSAEYIFDEKISGNKTLTWILRFVGFILMFIGLMLIAGPITTVLDVIPVLGDLLSFGVALFAAIIAFVLSLITIAIAWFFYRPLLSLALIAIAVGAIFSYKMGQKPQDQPAEA